MQSMKDIQRKGAMAMVFTISPSSICSSQSFSITINKPSRSIGIPWNCNISYGAPVIYQQESHTFGSEPRARRLSIQSLVSNSFCTVGTQILNVSNIMTFPVAHSEFLVNFQCPQTSIGEENKVIQTLIE